MPYKTYEEAMQAYKNIENSRPLDFTKRNAELQSLRNYYPGIEGDVAKTYSPFSQDVIAGAGYLGKGVGAIGSLGANLLQTGMNTEEYVRNAASNYFFNSADSPTTARRFSFAGPTFTGFGDGTKKTTEYPSWVPEGFLDQRVPTPGSTTTTQTTTPKDGTTVMPVSKSAVTSTINRNTIGTSAVAPVVGQNVKQPFSYTSGAITSQPFLDEVTKTENMLESLLKDQLDPKKNDYIAEYKRANQEATDMLSLTNPYTADINDAIGNVKIAYQRYDKQVQDYGDALVEEYKKNRELVGSLENFVNDGIRAVGYENGSMNKHDETILKIAENKRNFANRMNDMSVKQAEIMLKFEEARYNKGNEYLGTIRALQKDYSDNKKQTIKEIMDARKQAREDNKLAVATLRQMATERETRRKNGLSVAKVVAPDILTNAQYSSNPRYVIEQYANKLGIDPDILAGAVGNEAYTRETKDRAYALAVQKAADAKYLALLDKTSGGGKTTTTPDGIIDSAVGITVTEN